MIFGISDEQKRRGTSQATISSGSQSPIKLKAIKIIMKCILPLEHRKKTLNKVEKTIIIIFYYDNYPDTT